MQRFIVLRFNVPFDTKKTGHFRDILLSQSLSYVLKKLNLTSENQTWIKRLLPFRPFYGNYTG